MFPLDFLCILMLLLRLIDLFTFYAFPCPLILPLKDDG